MKNKLLKIFIMLLPLGILSNCSDFRQAVGKEKVIPDEFSVALTPSLLIPPGYKIDPKAFKNGNIDDSKNNFNLSEEIEIKDKKEVSSFSVLFNSKKPGLSVITCL